MKPNRFLIAYSTIVTLVFLATVCLLLSHKLHHRGTAEFDRIRARRIDLVEPDGTERLILSNRHDYPGSFFHGKEVARPDRQDSAGLLMLDDEGTENGGLIFSGSIVNGKPVTAGHLSFDQYDQDQTISLSRSEEDGTTVSDLILSDQPGWRLSPETIDEFHARQDHARWTRKISRMGQPQEQVPDGTPARHPPPGRKPIRRPHLER